MSSFQFRRIPPSEVKVGLFEAVDPDTYTRVDNIINEVRKGGKSALLNIAVRFGDLPSIDDPHILLPQQLKVSYDNLPTSQQSLLQRTAQRIRLFATAQRSSISELSVAIPGGRAGHTVVPVQTAGCYAPGGRFPLPSSVLMTGLTATAAGVPNVWMASPPPAEITKAAAYVAGVAGLLCIGGAQAIAAFAYGIGDVPVCDVICGPGNKYVTAAKKIVSGMCGIDMLAGPSELLVLADDSADPDLIAADLLAQAEHDTEARPMLVTTSPSLITQVEHALNQQLAVLSTAATASEALKKGFVILCPNDRTAMNITNILAPEHLEVLVKDYESVGEELSRYGSYGGIFIGPHSAEVLGDYGAGPNHTLPTAGTARYAAGLSVFNFLRIRTWMRIDDPAASQPLVRDSIALAELEGLVGHSKSAQKRLIQQNNQTNEQNGVVEEEQVEGKPSLDSIPAPTTISTLPSANKTGSSSVTLSDPASFKRSDWRNLLEYQPVKPLEVVAAEIGLPVSELSKLNANENLYGPLPEAREAVKNAVLHIYPDPDQNAIRHAIADYTGFAVNQILAGAGSDDTMDILMRVVDPKAIITSSPTFPMYSFFAKLQKTKIIDVPLGSAPTWDIDVDGIIRGIREGGATIVFLCSPNNPTGSLVSNSIITLLCQEKALIVVDEAYAEFADSNAFALLNSHSNLIILRTFSKWAGLAGLRAGYMVAHPSLITAAFQVKQPYNINVAATAAVIASLNGSARLLNAVDRIKFERSRLMRALAAFSWLTPLPSQANFLLVAVAGIPPRQLQAELHRSGVLVRCYAGGHYKQLDSYIRISCGRPRDTDRLLEVLHKIEDEHGLHNTTATTTRPQTPSSSTTINTTGTATCNSSHSLLLSRLHNVPVRAILFDMDGVLADVSQSYRAAIIQTAASFGVEITNEQITALKNAGNANNDWDVTWRLINKPDSVSLAQVTDRFQSLYLGIDGKNGLREKERLLLDVDLLSELSSVCPLAVVTGRPRDDAEYFLHHHNIVQYFTWLTCMEDAALKPSPEPILLALQKLNLIPTVPLTSTNTMNTNAVYPIHTSTISASRFNNGFAYMIGDTPDDIRSAIAANTISPLPVIPLGVPPPADKQRYHTADVLYAAGAARVFSNLRELQELVLKKIVDVYGGTGSNAIPPIQTTSSNTIYTIPNNNNPIEEKKETPPRHTAHPSNVPSSSSAASMMTMLMMSGPPRRGELKRVTKETTVYCEVCIDGTGQSNVSSGIGYLDHMLSALAKHGGLDLTLTCNGDLYIDDHHSTEDCGLTLGATLNQALGDKKGITRFGSAYVPLDEALSRAVVDISGRPHSELDLGFKREKIGDVSTEMLVHFIYSLSMSAGWTIHVDVLRGSNDHHRAESAFKALAQAMKQAMKRTGSQDIPSTKGVL